MTYGPPIPYMVCRNLITVNDGNLEMGSSSRVQCDFFRMSMMGTLKWGPPTCTGNLVTVNDGNLVTGFPPYVRCDFF